MNTNVNTENLSMAERRKKGLLWVDTGENVWIEPPLTLAMGNTVTIGKGSVIGAGSVVTRNVPPMSFAAGVPCKVIREITEEDLNEFAPIPE